MPARRILNAVERGRGSLAAAATFALVAGTGFAQGGYFPGAWGWATLGAAWAAAAAILARERLELARPALAACVLLTVFTIWTALSAFWSVTVTNTALEAERNAVYAAAFLAAVLLARTYPERLLHGAWLAICAISGWALATRLVPDRWGVVDAIAEYRLAGTIGYWNSLGLLAAMGVLLALGIAARGATPWGRALAAASAPGLLTTLYFTYSRGAWLALGLGLLAVVAIDTRRLQLLASAVPALVCSAPAVWRASVSPALTTTGASLGRAAHEGHRLVLVVAAVSVAAGLMQLALTRADSRIPRTSRRLATALGAFAAVVALVVAGALAPRAWNTFAHSSVAPSASLNGRLFHLSGTGRATQWRVAWHQVQAYPALGSGAASYEIYWNRHRPNTSRIRNVHNLYLETLADLGPVGLLLLLGALGLPLATGLRLRAGPLVPAAYGAFVAYLLHAVVDWDWQIAAVTLVPLVCAAVLLDTHPVGLSGVTRRAALALAALLAVAGLYTIASRIPLDKLSTATAHAQWAAARRDADRAAALAPWSSEPWIALGEGELNAGRGDLARPAFVQATRRDARNWVAWYDLARASHGAEHDRALARARALNPLSPELGALGR